MKNAVWFGLLILFGQSGWYLYSGNWISIPLLIFTGTGPNDAWESWHGLRTVLSYIPTSGVLIVIGLGAEAEERESDRQRQEMADRRREEEELRARR